MIEEKKIDNLEINDKDLGEVSGGSLAFFDCNKCKNRLEFGFRGHGAPDGEVTCSNCKTAYIISPSTYRVTQKGTDKGVGGLVWDWDNRGNEKYEKKPERIFSDISE